MKTQPTKKLPVFTAIIIFSILIFNGSCSKNPDSGNPNGGGSKIIYTDVKPDSVILKLQTDSFNLDLKNDGITDFVFNRSETFFIVKCGRSGPQIFVTSISLTLKPVSGSSAIMTSGSSLSQAQALDSSTVIAPDSLWTTTSQVLLKGVLILTRPIITTCSQTLPRSFGNWLNVSDKYLGLKFIKGNDIYYGWARLSSSYRLITTSSNFTLPIQPQLIIGQLIIKDYAYNSIPNQPILAGQTK